MTDAEAQHMKFTFEGYRSYVAMSAEAEDESPYSPDGARDFSWREGYRMARQDASTSDKEKER